MIFSPGDVSGQLNAAPPTCPGDTFIFKCSVTGDRNGVTIWSVGNGSAPCYTVHPTMILVNLGVLSQPSLELDLEQMLLPSHQH